MIEDDDIEGRLDEHIKRERQILEAGGDTLLADVEKFISRFSVHPSEHARVAHVLWIGHTHLMDQWDSTPRLAFLSPELASGKTRALEVTELLVPSPVQAVNVSPAYLFRKVGEQGGCTILFDEIDTVFGPKAKENEEIRGLLNAGHRRGAVAGRCVTRGKEVFTEEIPAYCAVALAGIGSLPDTILSRSVLIRMQRRKPGEAVEQFRRRKELGAGHKLRDRLAQWARQIEPTITLPDIMPTGVEDRDADVWEALVAVADAAGGDWPKRAREAAKALIKEAHDVEPSLGIRLLADLKTVLGDADHMTTEAILHALHTMPESPWNDLRGKQLNDRGLAQRLRQYGIKSRNIRISPNPQDVRKGYAREDFHDAWQAYVPPPKADASATSATGATGIKNPSRFNAENVADADDASATDAQTSATSPADVADDASNVADDVADKREKNANGNNNVADVALVALPPETQAARVDFSGRQTDRTDQTDAASLDIPACLDRRGEVCAQCGRPGGAECAYDGVTIRLHSECQRPWIVAHETSRRSLASMGSS
jgi:Protein of unknown function (DUF3631)